MQNNLWNDIVLSCEKSGAYIENLKDCTDEEEFKILFTGYITNEVIIKNEMCEFINILLEENERTIDYAEKNLGDYKRRIMWLKIENFVIYILGTIFMLKALNVI